MTTNYMPISYSPQGMLPRRANASLGEAAVEDPRGHLGRSRLRLSLRQEKHLRHGRARVTTVALSDSFQGRPIAAAGADEDEVEITSLGILSERE